MIDRIEKMIKEKISNFITTCSLNAPISEDKIVNFKSLYDMLKSDSYQKLKINHLNGKISDNKLIERELLKKVKNLIDEIESKSFNEDLMLILEKIEAISINFEFCGDRYSDAKKIIMEKVNTATTKFENFLKNENYDGCVDQISLILIFESKFKRHFTEYFERDASKYDSRKLMEFAEEYLSKVLDIDENNDVFTEEIIKSITNKKKIIENIQFTNKYSIFISESFILQKLRKIKEFIKSIFESTYNDLKSSLDNKNKNNENKNLNEYESKIFDVNQLEKKFAQITIIERHFDWMHQELNFSTNYTNLKSDLLTIVNFSVKEIENFLDKKDYLSIDFEVIEKSYLNFKNYGWINNIKKDAFDGFLISIKQKISEILSKLEMQDNILEFSINNYKEIIVDAYKNYNQLQRCTKLCDDHSLNLLKRNILQENNHEEGSHSAGNNQLKEDVLDNSEIDIEKKGKIISKKSGLIEQKKSFTTNITIIFEEINKHIMQKKDSIKLEYLIIKKNIIFLNFCIKNNIKRTKCEDLKYSIKDFLIEFDKKHMEMAIDYKKIYTEKKEEGDLKIDIQSIYENVTHINYVYKCEEIQILIHQENTNDCQNDNAYLEYKNLILDLYDDLKTLMTTANVTTLYNRRDLIDALGITRSCKKFDKIFLLNPSFESLYDDQFLRYSSSSDHEKNKILENIFKYQFVFIDKSVSDITSNSDNISKCQSEDIKNAIYTTIYTLVENLNIQCNNLSRKENISYEKINDVINHLKYLKNYMDSKICCNLLKDNDFCNLDQIEKKLKTFIEKIIKGIEELIEFIENLIKNARFDEAFDKIGILKSYIDNDTNNFIDEGKKEAIRKLETKVKGIFENEIESFGKKTDLNFYDYIEANEKIIKISNSKHDAYKSLANDFEEKIKQKIFEEMNKLDKIISFNDRNEKILKLKNIIDKLTDNIKHDVKIRYDITIEEISKIKNKRDLDLQEALQKNNFKEIGKKYLEYKEEKHTIKIEAIKEYIMNSLNFITEKFKNFNINFFIENGFNLLIDLKIIKNNFEDLLEKETKECFKALQKSLKTNLNNLKSEILKLLLNNEIDHIDEGEMQLDYISEISRKSTDPDLFDHKKAFQILILFFQFLDSDDSSKEDPLKNEELSNYKLMKELIPKFEDEFKHIIKELSKCVSENSENFSNNLNGLKLYYTNSIESFEKHCSNLIFVFLKMRKIDCVFNFLNEIKNSNYCKIHFNDLSNEINKSLEAAKNFNIFDEIKNIMNTIKKAMQDKVEMYKNKTILSPQIINEFLPEFKDSIIRLNLIINVLKQEPFIEKKIEKCYEEEIRKLIEDLKSLIVKYIDKCNEYLDSPKTKFDNFESINMYFIIFDYCIHNFDKDYKFERIETEFKKIKTRILLKIKGLVFYLNNNTKKFIENNPPNNEVIDKLLELRTIGTIILYKNGILEDINNLLSKLLKECGTTTICILATNISSNRNNISELLIEENPCFIGYRFKLFNQKFKYNDKEYVKKNIRLNPGDELDFQLLDAKYAALKKIFEEEVLKNISNFNEKELVDRILSFQTVQSTDSNVSYDYRIYKDIPEIMACIFALITLQSKHLYSIEVDGRNYLENLFQVHDVQIIGIFRIFGLIDKKVELCNNLVQLGTGEGKSIIISVTAIIFALLGCEVSCACYSQYLSDRDKKFFDKYFKCLGLDGKINFGTFQNLYERELNEGNKFDIREHVLYVIRNVEKLPISKNDNSRKPKILIIDEVDVFLSKEFYGNAYNPSAQLKDESIEELIKYIWKYKDNKSEISYSKIKTHELYQNCIKKFESHKFIIEESVKEILYDLKSYRTETLRKYRIENGKIEYFIQGQYVKNYKIGYKTMFTYISEHLNGSINDFELSDKICIDVKCGKFSYASIADNFKYIVGVTGTLDTLNGEEQTILNEKYKIKRYTFLPSVFGDNNISFCKKKDIHIVNEHTYYSKIIREIQDNLNRTNSSQSANKRPVLVVFESSEELEKFYQSDKFCQDLKDRTQILREELPEETINDIITYACTANKITLLTKSFGRGTDFKYLSSEIGINGGSHVCQVYLSEELSEEVQIKGRTARQGENGSYSLVINKESLQKFEITDQEIEEYQGNYEELFKIKRLNYFKIQFNKNKEIIQYIQQMHKKSTDFLTALKIRDMTKIDDFLKEENKLDFSLECLESCRTLVVMDATGSMENPFNKAKHAVNLMFSRAQELLKNQNIKIDLEMKFIAYRNYSSKEKICEASSWETKPGNLFQYLSTVETSGGQNNEAIEIGLYNAAKEIHKGISQVILIGDMTPNTQKEIKVKREQYANYWNGTEYKKETFYKTEVEKFKTSGIKINCFYVHQNAKVIFDEIAKYTRGESKFLDVNSENGINDLTNFVNEFIMKYINDINGNRGVSLVDMYRQKFKETYSSSNN